MFEPTIATANKPALGRPRRHAIADKLLLLVAWSAGIIVTFLLLWIVGDVIRQGIGEISLDYLLTAPLRAGRAGGVGPIVVSTLLILMVCLLASVPLGLGTAVLLAEFSQRGGLASWLIRRSLDVLAGVPSIVFGLFGNAFFCIYLKMGFSILSGGLTLACMVLPLLIQSTEMGLRQVPQDYRQASAALGISKLATLWHILLPAAMPGLLLGVVLSTSRALAETAALLFTSGYVDRMPESLLDSGRSLSIHIFDLAMNVPGGTARAYGAATLLLALLLGINLSISLGLKIWAKGDH